MIRWLLIAPFFVLVVYAIFSSFKYTRMISRIFMGLVYKPFSIPAEVVRGERVVILDSSGREIEALIQGGPDARRLVIFCHESGQGKGSWERYAGFLADEGTRVLSIDFDERSNTDETNAFSQWPHGSDIERLLTATRWAKKMVEPVSPVILFGVSKGANIALGASFRMPMSCVVVADGLFSMKEIFRDYIRRWAPILVKPNLFGEHYPDWVVNIFTELGFWHCGQRSKKKFIDVEKCLRQRHVPLLMIHGEADDYVPVSHQRFLKSLPKGSVSYWSVSGAAHNEAVLTDRASYEKKVVDFIKSVSGS